MNQYIFRESGNHEALLYEEPAPGHLVLHIAASVSWHHKSDLIFYNDGQWTHSHNTAQRWLISAYQNNKKLVRKSLIAAKGRITVSFDGWKSDTQVDYLGVVAHYLDSNYRPKTTLLALRSTYGSHTGETMMEHLQEVIKDYRISNKLSFFMADNASNNDKAIRLLAAHFDFHPTKSRLRCTGHTTNLVCKSILYGVNVDCLEEALRSDTSEAEGLYDDSVAAFERELRAADGYQPMLHIWRKKGPLRKLHNIVVHARATPTRRHFFLSKQKEARPRERFSSSS